jgi:hypothetical protein
MSLNNFGAQVDLGIVGATDFGPATITFTNPDGTPVNLTSFTAAAAIKQNQTGAVLATFTISIPTPANGIALMSMPEASTVALTPGAYVWDFKLTNGSGLVSRPLWGNVTVTRYVTP